MTVTIALSPALAERAGGRSSVHVDATSVATALRELTTRFPDLAELVWRSDDKLHPLLVILLQDQDIQEAGGLKTSLRPGDELSLVTAMEESS